VRAYARTEEYQKALRKRQVWVEPLFGEAKQWHQRARFRLRRLHKVNVEGLLTAAGQNLKRFLKAVTSSEVSRVILSKKIFAFAKEMRPCIVWF